MNRISARKSMICPPAINGASAWYGPDMVKRTNWIYRLTDADIAESNRPCSRWLMPKRYRADHQGRFCPADIGAEARRHQHRGPRRARLRPDARAAGRALVDPPIRDRLLRHRHPLRQRPLAERQGHVLGHVRDLGRDAVNDPTARVYQTAERQTFHTDSCDIVALLCLKTAKSGGASALVSSMTIYNEMLKRRPDLLPCMFEAMHTDRRGEVPAGQKPWPRYPRPQLAQRQPLGALRAALH